MKKVQEWLEHDYLDFELLDNTTTQIAAIALPPSTTHPQLRAELLTF